MARLISKKVSVSQAEYENIKDLILERKVVNCLDINISKLNINNLDSINIGGNIVKLSNNAVKGLGECLGVTKKFVKIIHESGLDSENKLLNLIVTAIKGKRSQAVTLVYNIGMNEIVNIYPVGSKVISDAQYFNALESILAKTPGAYLRNIVTTPSGDIKATISNPKMEFDVKGRVDEAFKSGMTLDIDHKGMYTSFFTERLVCANGQVSTETFNTVSVKTAEKIPDFLAGLMSPDYHISNIFEFKKRLVRVSNSTASLREVLLTERSLKSLLGNMADTVMVDMSSSFIKSAFTEEHMENKDVHRFLRTPLSVWDLVNEITAVSSKIEQESLKVDAYTNLSIQMLGGDRMFKVPDLGPDNLKQVF